MAAPLRYPLILLARGAMAAIYLPLLPAAGELVGAARSPAHWRALFADPQLGQALAATLVSHAVVRRRRAADRPDHRRRPLAFGPLAAAGFPSAAAAGGAPSRPGDGGAAAVRRRGWLWQQLLFLTPPVDRYGIGLGLTMALKRAPLCCG